MARYFEVGAWRVRAEREPRGMRRRHLLRQRTRNGRRLYVGNRHVRLSVIERAP